jgi:superfamily II DNA or RNA helicase
MKLRVSNINTRVASASTKEDRWLRELLAVDVPTARFAKAYKDGHWDGKKHFYDREERSFPSGLVPVVLEENAERPRPFTIELIDRRRNPFETRLKTTTEIWARFLREAGFEPDVEKCEYQARGIRKIVRNKLNGMPWIRGLVNLPTGSGKTVMAAGVIRALKRPRTLIVCDRLDLLLQTRDVLEQVLGQDIGVVGGGEQDLASVTVGMVQTLKTRVEDEDVAKWIRGVRLLIIDECHKVGDNTYARVIERVPAFARLGLSATALQRGDPGDVLLVGATGDIAYKLEADRLAARGLLATPVVELIPVYEPQIRERFGKKNNDKNSATAYKRVYDEGIVDNEERNRLIAEQVKKALLAGMPTMVLVKLVRHGNLLLEALKDEDVEAEYLRGEDPVTHRRRVVRGFKEGRVSCIVASTIFDEAIDIPNIRQLVLAGGGNSSIKAIQRIGRGMRAKEGENRLYVIDFLDLTHRVLRKNSMERVQIYEQQGYEVQEQGDTW